MRRQVGCQGEGEGGVDVHGELERGQGKAGQVGEEAVERGGFIQEEG